MLESLNGFFIATYAYSKAFYGIQSLAVMSLAGIGMGLASQLFIKGWRSTLHRLQSKKA